MIGDEIAKTGKKPIEKPDEGRRLQDGHRTARREGAGRFSIALFSRLDFSNPRFETIGTGKSTRQFPGLLPKNGFSNQLRGKS